MELVKDMLQQALKMKLSISQELEAQDIQELQLQKCPLNFNQIANLDNNVLLDEYGKTETSDEDDVMTKTADEDDVDQATAAKLASHTSCCPQKFHNLCTIHERIQINLKLIKCVCDT